MTITLMPWTELMLKILITLLYESEVVLNVGSRLEFMDVEIKRNKAVVKMRAHSMDKKFTD